MRTVLVAVMASCYVADGRFSAQESLGSALFGIALVGAWTFIALAWDLPRKRQP